ncbi:MAG: inositol monophosphatase family protein [Gemmatimonadales bacterium]
MPSANDLLNIAVRAATQAGDYLRTVHRPAPEAWASKGKADWATEVDRTAEAMIAGTIREATPGAHIIGEELTPEVVRGGLVWVVDPLDGTTNFLHGFPAFAVSIAAAVDGVLEAAVVLHVPLNRLTTATRGGGTWETDQRVHVSTITDPAHALIGTGFPFKDLSRLEEYLQQFRRISAAVTGVRRPGSAALDLADVAAGRFEGFWEQRLSAWDIAAGTLLVREAGGRVTDFAGRDLGVEHAELVAGNAALHPWLLSQVGARSAAPAPSVAQFSERVSAKTPAPGGGAVAATVTALAAALVTMVGRLTHEGAAEAGIDQLIEQGERLRLMLLDLGEADAAAYGKVIAARRRGAEGAADLAQAWEGAARVPADVLRAARDVALLARRAAHAGPPAALGDAVMAALLAAAAAAGSMINLRLNTQAAGHPAQLRLLVQEAELLLRETQRATADSRMLLEQRLQG